MGKNAGRGVSKVGAPSPMTDDSNEQAGSASEHTYTHVHPSVTFAY